MKLLWLFLPLLSSLPSLLVIARYITSAHQSNNTEQLHDIKGSAYIFAKAYAVQIYSISCLPIEINGEIGGRGHEAMLLCAMFYLISPV